MINYHSFYFIVGLPKSNTKDQSLCSPVPYVWYLHKNVSLAQ